VRTTHIPLGKSPRQRLVWSQRRSRPRDAVAAACAEQCTKGRGKRERRLGLAQ
jgi:hypothetical protein